MSRKIHLITLALAAAAVAAPSAQANSAPSARAKVDPLAVSILRSRGFTPRQIEAWTVGPCSHQLKPAVCFGPSKGAGLASVRAKVDPGRSSASRAKVLCSRQVNPAACF
jgi:hypothetical protein